MSKENRKLTGFECVSVLEKEQTEKSSVKKSFVVTFKRKTGDKLQLHTENASTSDLFVPGAAYAVSFANPQTKLTSANK